MAFFIPDMIVNKITEITADILNNMNVSGLIIDVDSTLAAHGKQIPYIGVKKWIADMKKHGIKLMILSNNSHKRVKPFADMLELGFYSRAAKPLPFSVKAAAEAMNLDTEKVAVVGDQVYTDILAGKLAGAKTVLLRVPTAKESGFIRFKRKMEHPVRKAYYKKHGGKS